MADTVTRAKTMLFKYGSTYMTDYQKPKYTTSSSTVYTPEPTCPPQRFVPLKDVHTMTHWKDAQPRFDLMIRKKEIIRTNPNDKQDKFVKHVHVDAGLSEAIRTRPRVVMTPAVSMDDVEEPTRAFLIADTYVSSTGRAFAEVHTAEGVRAPFADAPAPANPVTLPKLRAPVVEPQWRMDTLSWESRQLRGHCDLDKEFWTEHSKKMRRCSVCKATENVRNQRALERSLKIGHY